MGSDAVEHHRWPLEPPPDGKKVSWESVVEVLMVHHLLLVYQSFVFTPL